MWGLYVIEKTGKKEDIPTKVTRVVEDPKVNIGGVLVDKDMHAVSEKLAAYAETQKEDTHDPDDMTNDANDWDDLHIVKPPENNPVNDTDSKNIWMIVSVIGVVSAIFIPFIAFFVVLSGMESM